MTVITTIGLDLAKNIFQVHGVDNQGRTTLQQRLSRGKVAAFFCKSTTMLDWNGSMWRITLLVQENL